MSMRLHINAKFLTRDQATNVARSLGAVTSSLVSGPNTRVADLNFLQGEHLERIWSWNTEVPAAAKMCVHHLVEEQARSQPDGVAIHAWDGHLTYKELNMLSEVLVGRLIEVGVGPEVLVPLCFEKSKWTSVAMLSVLKAGGAFVLLDPFLPEDRLQSIIQQLRVDFILSSAFTRGLSLKLAKTVVQVDGELLKSTYSTPSIKVASQPSSTMFVVFTSGSTGTPKGVILTHQNFCSGLHHQAQLLGFTKRPKYSTSHRTHSTFRSTMCLPLLLLEDACASHPKKNGETILQTPWQECKSQSLT